MPPLIGNNNFYSMLRCSRGEKACTPPLTPASHSSCKRAQQKALRVPSAADGPETGKISAVYYKLVFRVLFKRSEITGEPCTVRGNQRSSPLLPFPPPGMSQGANPKLQEGRVFFCPASTNLVTFSHQRGICPQRHQ